MPDSPVTDGFRLVAAFHPEAADTLVRFERACACLAMLVQRGVVDVDELDPVFQAFDALTALATRKP